jgi:hypothetical protein
MDILLETTDWNCSYDVPNHIYILDGSKLVAYVPDGQNKPFFFSKPRPFDKKNRKFEKLGRYIPGKGLVLS